MVKPSTANMASLMAALQLAAGDFVWNFLQNETAQTYEAALSNIQVWLGANASNNSNLRVVLTLADGTVAIDTSKSNNTFSNFQLKGINENHNTRGSILTALISNAGTGMETKYSTTTFKQTYYYAQRMGQSPEEAVGILRVSITD
jgi:hypothetical protein